MNIPQYGLPEVDQVFNLAAEQTQDGERLFREKVEAERAAKAAADYQKRMQRVLSDCPGFIGADAPAGQGKQGAVVVDPRMATDARVWLKRRFHVNESLSLTRSDGLCFEVRTRERKPLAPGAKRLKVTWDKPKQFELSLGI